MIVYNKNTRVWSSTVDGAGFATEDGWIYEPVFENEEFARGIGQAYWTFDGSTIKTPTEEEYAALVLQQQKDEMWRAIQAERDRRTANGVRVGVNWFHSDTPSRIQQLGLVIMGAGLPSGIMWKTMGGQFVQMTPQLAGQIFQTVAGTDQAIFATAEVHKVQMYATADPLSYNFLSSTPAWPPTFKE